MKIPDRDIKARKVGMKKNFSQKLSTARHVFDRPEQVTTCAIKHDGIFV